jgi:hypothetical protein
MAGDDGRFPKPDRRAVVVFLAWFCLLMMFILCDPWPSRSPAGPARIFSEPGLVVRDILLIPVHPLLFDHAPCAFIHHSLVPEIISHRTYRTLAKLAVIPGWALILGTLALSGRPRFRIAFYFVLGLLSSLLLATYAWVLTAGPL